MTIPSTIQLELTGMAQGGDAVGRYDGCVVFASGGLPGEEVCVEIDERRKDFVRGHVTQVRTPSPERIEPRMPQASHMPWQHIAYDAQLRYKQQIVQEQLAKVGWGEEQGVVIAPVIPAASPWHYRNTAHLHADDQHHIGYYAAGTHTVLDMVDDPLLLPHLNDALAGLRTTLSHWNDGAIKSVTLRGSAAYGYTTAIVHGTGKLSEVSSRWRARTPSLAGCILSDLNRKNEPLPHDITLHEELGGIVFSLSPESFFQVHTAQAETLIRVVQNMLDPHPSMRLLDAYSGVGSFALPLAHLVKSVVAIEEHPQAVADGRRTAALNDRDNVTFHAGQVERTINAVAAQCDAVILDPPRRGCHPMALASVVELALPRLVYVSCHPGVLARDVRFLGERGYRLVQVQPVDMFPHTPHIESVALVDVALST